MASTKSSGRNWRRSREYRLWRVAVLRRDKRCAVCGSLKQRHAHHLNHASYFPELRFDMENGLVLCRHHHMLFHNVFIGGTRRKCTRADMERYLKLVLDIVGEVNSGDL